MSDGVPEERANLEDEKELGTPIGSGPVEDGAPVEDSPEPESVSAPEPEVETPVEEPEHNWEQRYGDLRTVHNQTAEEKKQAIMYAQQLQAENIRLQQQMATQQPQANDYRYDDYGNPVQQQTPQQPATPTPEQQMVVGLVTDRMREITEQHIADRPEINTPERLQIIEKKMYELGWNPTNVTSADLGRYRQIMQDATTLCFGHVEAKKQQAEQKKLKEQKAKEAQDAKVAAGPSESSMGTPEPKKGDMPEFNPETDDPGEWVSKVISR